MYKRLSALLMTGFITSSLFAQVPVITSQQFFQNNKVYPYKSALLLQQSAGPGGAGVVWDFSNIVFPNSTDTTVCISPAGTPAFLSCGISGTDTATICLVNRSFQFYRNDDYHYYLTRGGKIIEIGSDGDNGVVEDVNYQYAQPRIFSLMPFTYGAASVDSFRGTYDSYLTGPHTTRGTDRFIADGYGILKLAGTTYNHCVRIKQISDWADSCAMFGKNDRHYECYTWYSTDKEGPVLTMVPDQNTGVFANYYFPQNAPAGVNRVGAGDVFALYPNPATGQIFLRFKNIPVAPIQLTVFNMLGQVVLTLSLSGQDNLIDVSRLANGTYGYQVGDPDSRQSGTTFIKQ